MISVGSTRPGIGADMISVGDHMISLRNTRLAMILKKEFAVGVGQEIVRTSAKVRDAQGKVNCNNRGIVKAHLHYCGNGKGTGACQSNRNDQETKGKVLGSTRCVAEVRRNLHKASQRFAALAIKRFSIEAGLTQVSKKEKILET